MSACHPLREFYDTVSRICATASAAYDPDSPDPGYWDQFGGPSPGINERLEALKARAIRAITADSAWGRIGIDLLGLGRIMDEIILHLGIASTKPGAEVPPANRQHYLTEARDWVDRHCSAAWRALPVLQNVVIVVESVKKSPAVRGKKAVSTSARGSGKGRVMRSAAKKTSGPEGPARLPGPDAHPIEVVRFGPEALTQIHSSRERLQSALIPPDDGPVIWYHGGKSYSADGRNPLTVTDEIHNALKAFLDKPDEAITHGQLKGRGVTNPTTAVTAIKKRFGENAVRSPLIKGSGYFCRVQHLKRE